MAVGAVTDGSAKFTAKVDDGPMGVSISTDPSFSSVFNASSVAVDADGVATSEVSILQSDTRYYWRVRDDGVRDDTITGQLLTDPTPGEPASFTIGCVGDAGLRPQVPGVSGAATSRLSNHPVFDTVRERALAEDWRRLVHLGDICYYDLGSGNHGLSSTASAAQYRTMWDDILAQPRQHELYRSVPWVYVWDDHDYGPNDSDSTAPGRDNACTVYRERVPSYDLPAGSGANPVYHSFHIGRVLFVVSDTRADRDPSASPPTMLGSAQLAWLDSLLGSDESAALVWLMPTPWIGSASDTWAGFTAERATLVEMLDDHGWLSKTFMVNADKHVVALESGQGGNANHGGFPIMLCAPLDAAPGTITTTYDGGMWAARAQYGTVTVTDTGDDIAISGTVWRRTRALGSVTLTTGGTTHISAGGPPHVIAL